MRLWPQPRAPLNGRHFDVAIIGGGINGVAIARECARAGRRTLLLEQNDFASGTTSRSTRIIHGGLRYLEHGEIGLVRESLRERQRLMQERPHLVRPMQFVLALPHGRHSSLEIRLGLWLYRRFAKASQNKTPANLDQLLDTYGDSRALRVFTYDDAQCEFPERLVAEWLVDALEFGATARNHTRVLSVQTSNGRVRGLRLRDQLGDVEYEVSTTHVVNATGPWADAVCRDSGISASAPMVGGVRGSHIVLPSFPGAPASALYSEAPDGRPVFVIPWNGQVLAGTTEVRDDGDPSAVQPSPNEIEYLASAVRRLFPDALRDGISYAFAGIRPLAHAPDKSASAITRRHFLHDHTAEGAAGLISVIGGKLTTAASLARECVRLIGISVSEPQLTTIVDPNGFNAPLDRLTRDIALIAGVEDGPARALVFRHGPRAVAIAHHIAIDDRLRQPVAEGSNFLLAEATFAIQREAAVTLADVLLRRVPAALGPDWSDEAARQAVGRLGEVLGWSEAVMQKELEEFASERSRFLVSSTVARVAA